MRIVQIVETLDVGGAERIAVELSNALARRHRVTVVCVQHAGLLAGQLSPGISVRSLDQPSGNDLRAPIRLAALLRELDADVIHTHHWGVFLEAVAAGLLARVPGMVHTVHGLYMQYPDGYLSGPKRAMRHWLERRSVGYCRHVVCVSAELAVHCRDEIGLAAECLVVIPNGVALNGQPRRPAARPGGEYVFVSAGRLAAVKNQRMLISAFAAACRSQSNLRLVIAGEGPERAALEQLIVAEGVRDRVDLVGVVVDVDALLCSADAFVLSSTSEGLPMAILEAMRARLPVLATRVGGVSTVVDNGVTGILVEAGDLVAMSAGMLRLARSPAAAAAMGEAAFLKLQAHFGLESMVDAYERLYASAG